MLAPPWHCTCCSRCLWSSSPHSFPVSCTCRKLLSFLSAQRAAVLREQSLFADCFLGVAANH